VGQLGTFSTAPALYPNLGYDPVTDFTPIGRYTATPYLLVARGDFPPPDLKQFGSYVKENIKKINAGHAGVGSVSFTTCLLLNSLLDVKPTLVPFSGAGQAMTSLIAGQIDYMCDAITTASPHIRAKAIKAYAITAQKRSDVVPEIPTSAEAGLPDFQMTSWSGIFAPKAIPQPISDEISKALDRALDDPMIVQRLAELGAGVPSRAERGQEQLSKLVQTEVARWTPIIKAANVKLE
jgi:tripartite-type tricarboxylate transporter receptor subunit TctC